MNKRLFLYMRIGQHVRVWHTVSLSTCTLHTGLVV